MFPTQKKPTATMASQLLQPVLIASLLATGQVNAEEPLELESTTVTAEKEQSYIEKASTSATRTDTPLTHVPQSVVVVPRQMIVDQGAKTVSDALRNVSNITPVDPRDTNNTPFRIRGFTAATVVDGVAMPGYFPNAESLVNVERIDVIKGPSGGLFGSSQGAGSFGSLGGTVALTTSAPTQSEQRQISFSAGTFDSKGVSFDINQPLNSDFAVRMVGEVTDSDSETDEVFFKKKALFPSLAWTPNDETKVVLRLRYLEDNTLDYSGLPSNGTVFESNYKIDRDTFITAEGQPDTINRSKGANLQWTQVLNDTWTFGLTTAYNETKLDQYGVAALDPMTLGFGGPGPDYFLAGVRLWDEWKSTTIAPSLTGKFATGALQHTLNFGVDYEKTYDDAFMAFSDGTGMGLGLISLQPIDIRNPQYPDWLNTITPAEPDQKNRYTSRVFYIQDQVDVGSWHFLASLRHSKVEVEELKPNSGNDSRTSRSKTTPRIGAVYEFTPHLSAFTGYSESIKVPTVSLFSESPKAEEAKQMEIGLRMSDFYGFSASLAWFELTRENATVADPLNLGFSRQTGEQRSRGYELDARWQVTPAWSWLGSYSSQDAEITKDTSTVLVGKQLFNIPERTARLATRYEVLDGALAGMGFGLGLAHTSALPGNSTNTFFTDSATVWDAQVSYRIKGARYGLNISNLANKEYYVPSTYFGGGHVIPAMPRTVTASAQFTF